MRCNRTILHHQQRGAFTLVEMIMSVVIMSMVFLGLQSAIMLAGRAAPSAKNGSLYAAGAGQGMDQFSADLSTAISITTMTTTSVQFTVPDRTGDGVAETIGYSWSGNSGDPLMRTINNGSAASIVPNVTEFALTYDKRSQLQPTTYTESAEQTLSSYSPAITLLNIGNGAIDSNHSYGQTFLPSLPSNAVKWRVTRAQFVAESDGPAIGSTRVQLRAVSGTTPGLVCDETSMAESSLSSSYSWAQVYFTGNYQFAAGASAALVFQWYSDAKACDIQYQALLALAANANLITSTNGGATWSAPLTQDMPYYIFGTYFTANPAVTNYYLTDVRCNLRSGSDSNRIHTTIPTLNQPQVTGP